jgi:[ribosomal protein S18]-alanine N-acetyltransferase
MNITGKLRQSWPLGAELILLEKIEKDFFPRPWSLQQWEELDESRHYFFNWLNESGIVGFALFAHLSGDETAHLLKICLVPEYRGKGHAESFWTQIVASLKVKQVRYVFLEVENSNIIGLNFYKKIGFVTLRSIRNYYSDGVSGTMMQLTL